MTYFERLVEAGIRPDCALDTCHWYEKQGDESSLEKYVSEAEERAERRKTGGDNKEVCYG